MSDTPSITVSIGGTSTTVATLNLNQQRAIGSALFKVPLSTGPDDFDFDAEFASAVSIVFAALNRASPADTVKQEAWISGIDATFAELQSVKAQVLKFAGYLKSDKVTQIPVAAGATSQGEPQPDAI